MNLAEKARIAREEAEKENELNKAKNAEKEALNKIKDQIKQIATNKKWSIVKFGNYYNETGKEPIEWIVLDNLGDEITLVSKYVIDCHDFCKNSDRKWTGDISWELSDIREWLNHEFLEKAFSKNEQNFIIKKEIDSTCTYQTGCDDICTTKDKVYLLSRMDIRKGRSLFGNKLKKCKPTKYALSKMVYGGKHKCLWWLRDTNELYYVSGGIGYTGQYVYCGGQSKYVCINNNETKKYLEESQRKKVGVRPVITLKVED